MVWINLLKGSGKNAKQLPSQIPVQLDFSSLLARFLFKIRVSILNMFLYETLIKST